MADIDSIKSILRLFGYGLYVACSASSEGPRSATVSWVTQVSFEPKLIAVALRKGTAICAAVQESQHFSLHIVGERQQDFARAFFKAPFGADGEIGGYRYRLTERGTPVIGGGVAWLECEVASAPVTEGDHLLFIARILDGDLAGADLHALALRDTPWHYGG